MRGSIYLRKVICIPILLSVFYSCDEIVNPLQDDKKEFITNLNLIDNSGKSYIPFFETDTTIFYLFPQSVDITRISLKSPNQKDSLFRAEEKYAINSDLREFDLSDFTRPYYYSGAQNAKLKKVIICDLPVIVLETPEYKPIDSKVERLEGCSMKLFMEDGKIYDLGFAGVKGRGHSTWKEPKKPYNIKLEKKKEILGLNKSKHWVLLSNPRYDRTQLHNDVAFQIARMTDYPWVQSGRFVELILNGEHKSLYYLCEKIRIEDGKINISEIEPRDTIGDSLTGGYMLEADLSAKDENSIKTKYFNQTGDGFQYSLFWNIVKPEDDIQNQQVNYITHKLQYLESLISNETLLLNGEYRDLLDIDTAIDWWLVENLCLNEEASRTKNMIIYKDRDSSPYGGKFKVGPPWDFDAWTFGMSGCEKLYVNKTTWCFHQLFMDPVFVERLKERWDLLYYTWKLCIPEYIDKQYKIIYRSALRNEIMWPSWEKCCQYPQKSYSDLVGEMKDAFITQLEYMNTYINQLK